MAPGGPLRSLVWRGYVGHPSPRSSNLPPVACDYKPGDAPVPPPGSHRGSREGGYPGSEGAHRSSLERMGPSEHGRYGDNGGYYDIMAWVDGGTNNTIHPPTRGSSPWSPWPHAPMAPCAPMCGKGPMRACAPGSMDTDGEMRMGRWGPWRRGGCRHGADGYLSPGESMDGSVRRSGSVHGNLITPCCNAPTIARFP